MKIPDASEHETPWDHSHPKVRFLEDLLPAHHNRLQALSCRILGCPDLAADAVQDAVIQLWQLPDEPNDFVAWLFHAVFHRSLHLRRAATRRRHHERCACALERESKPDPAEEAFARELSCILEGVLHQLDPKLRRTFDLRHA